jgi:hypothetical protein
MSFRARIYLQRPFEKTASYIGEKELNDRPAMNAEVAFEHQGKTESGRIEVLQPEDWDLRGTVPLVTVVQSPSA